MPQLNPAPWFFLLCLVWSVLTLYMTMTSNITFYPTPTQEEMTTNKTFWNWPWY